MPLYRRSQTQEIVYIRRPINTSLTVQAYGSGDDYANPDTLFGDDETIMVAGTLVATDGADLSVATITIQLNGATIGQAALTFDPTTGVNYYQFTLGVLPEGDHTVDAVFRRLRVR